SDRGRFPYAPGYARGEWPRKGGCRGRTATRADVERSRRPAFPCTAWAPRGDSPGEAHCDTAAGRLACNIVVLAGRAIPSGGSAESWVLVCPGCRHLAAHAARRLRDP